MTTLCQRAIFTEATSTSHPFSVLADLPPASHRSFNQFKAFCKKFAIEFRFMDDDDPKEFEKKIDGKTKALCPSSQSSCDACV